MINDSTPHYGLPLPHPSNKLDEDAPRLRSALIGADAQLQALDDQLQALAGQLQSLAGQLQSLGKADVGLDQVDNTADVDKPVSTEQQAAINTRMPTAGGQFTGGINFGNAVGASAADLSRHISLHNSGYGIGITGSRMNYCVGAAASHRFMVGTTEVGSISAAGDLLASSNITAYSDPRLKQDFRRIARPLQLLARLDGGTFTWRAGFPHTAVKAGRRDYGVLADQVQAVMPEAVTDSPDIDGQTYKTVAYDKLVPVLIEAVKELSGRIDALEHQAGA